MLESNSLRDNRCDSSRTMSRGAAAPLFNPSSRRRHRTDRSPMPRKLHCIHKRNRPPASARSAQTDLECVTYVSGTNCYPCVRSGHGIFWWTTWDSNPRPPHCERGALPTELVAHYHKRAKPTTASCADEQLQYSRCPQPNSTPLYSKKCATSGTGERPKTPDILSPRPTPNGLPKSSSIPAG